MKTCNQVAERVALGEELGDLAEHAAECPHCKRLIALPVELGLTARSADPGMGFAARMTAGAQHRITVRRHRRYAAGGGLAVVAAAAVALLLVRQQDDASIAYVPLSVLHLPAIDPPTAHKDDPWKPHEPGEVDDDVRALVHLANVDRNRHLSAHWGRIEKSLAPYRAVLKGSEP
ncbi:MAG TPA: hypothetical protein VFQ65_30955 [Kofleriaceae bacterium]|nr:hypothetical protein [Kofleriaceae bacterium]